MLSLRFRIVLLSRCARPRAARTHSLLELLELIPLILQTTISPALRLFSLQHGAVLRGNLWAGLCHADLDERGLPDAHVDVVYEIARE